MKSHFAMAIVAASAVMVLSQSEALARTRSHGHQATPSDVEQVAVSGEGTETGTASYYSSRYNGRLTSSGRRYDPKELTAAHPWLPFGTKLVVRCAATGRSIVVTVTDRLPSNRRLVDLSRSAAEQLGIVRRGIAQVSITPV
jgi:rare lipoprotein A